MNYVGEASVAVETLGYWRVQDLWAVYRGELQAQSKATEEQISRTGRGRTAGQVKNGKVSLGQRSEHRMAG